MQCGNKVGPPDNAKCRMLPVKSGRHYFKYISQAYSSTITQ